MQNNLAPEMVLDQMHAAILCADFAALGALTPQLELALQDAHKMADPAQLRRLKSKAERNAACLLAAGRGVRAAQNRVTELRTAAAGLQTYNGKGQRADLGGQSRLTRRF